MRQWLVMLALSMAFTAPAYAEKLPDIAIESADGTIQSLSTVAKQKPLIVHLWASWCAPCLKELPSLAKRLAAEPDLPVVVLSLGHDSREAIARFFDKQSLALPISRDHDRTAFKAFAVNGLPASFFYDSTGQLTARHDGELSWQSEQAEALIQGINR